jgi:hypothetical protein
MNWHAYAAARVAEARRHANTEPATPPRQVQRREPRQAPVASRSCTF